MLRLALPIGVRDMQTFSRLSRPSRRLMWLATSLIEKMCNLLDRRPDLPTINSSSRGSLAGALAAGFPKLRAEALQNLDRDQYANSTRATRDLRWGLWLRLAQHGNYHHYRSPSNWLVPSGHPSRRGAIAPHHRSSFWSTKCLSQLIH